MQIVKQGGSRSVVEKNCENKNERRIALNSKARETTGTDDETKAVEEYLLSSQRFFIAQWASMLDKMIKKPSGDKGRPTTSTRENRDSAGKAFLKYWRENQDKKGIPEAIDNDFEKNWNLKVHSYSKPDLNDEKNKKKTEGKGSWYKVFAGDSEISNCNWDKVAEKIYIHLYEAQYEKNTYKDPNKEDKPTHKEGLIYRRAKSIAKSARRYKKNDTNGLIQALSQTEQKHIEALRSNPNWEELRKEYQLHALVKDLNDTESKVFQNWKAKDHKPKQQDRLLRRDALTCHYNHYARIFPSSDTDEKKALSLKDAKATELWKYHSIIKEALMQRCPKYQPKIRVNTKQALKIKSPPKAFTEDTLHKLALSIQTNRQMAFAIRLGKVIHYEGSSSEKTNLNNGLKAATPENLSNIIASEFWASKGQTHIKQNESFIRQWMGAIAIANSTLKHLLDPDNKKEDILLANADSLIKDLDSIRFDTQFKLLFGEEHNLYSSDHERNVLIKELINTLAQLRHATFHFKNIKAFNEQLDALQHSTESEDKIKEYIRDNQKKQLDLMADQLRSAHAESYLAQEQLDKIWQIIKPNKRDILPLPKFNKLLLRSENLPVGIKHNNTKVWFNEFKLINHATATEIENNNAYRCSFISLKLLYEYGFAQWLKDLIENGERKEINDWIEKAQNRATIAAQFITGQYEIDEDDERHREVLSKMSRLDQLGEGQKLESYFSYLTQEISSVFQIQTNIYESNRDEAKKLSNFVEEFKQDMLIQGFKKYIASLELADLFKISTLEKNYQANKSQLIVGALDCGKLENEEHDSCELKRPWFYMILHLMPVEFINHLALQIRKHNVLTYQKANESEYQQVYNAISLHLGVHNAKLKLTDLGDTQALRCFFKDNNTFDAVFGEAGNSLPIKGLREILRFGNIGQLCGLFANKLISTEDAKKFEQSENGIAILQSLRTELHNTITKKKKLSVKKRLKILKDAVDNDISLDKAPNDIDTINSLYQRVVVKNEYVQFSYNDKKVIYTELEDIYKEINQKIVTYRELKNKIYLHNHKQAHQLIMQVLGRLAGFSQLWERDLYFVMLALLSLNKITPDDYQMRVNTGEKDNETFEKMVEQGQIIKAWRKMNNDCKGQSVKEIYKKLDNLFYGIEKKVTIRNNLAHFNSLRKSNLINLTSLINDARTLVSHDRKVKNAVSRSIIEMLERHNLIIEFEMNASHQLKLHTTEGLKAKSINHLGDKTIVEELHGEKYVEIIKKLFE